VHADGFRAERGRAHALVLLPSGNPCLLERLAGAHNAELLRLDGPDALLAHCRDRGLGLNEGVLAELVGTESLAARRRERRRRGALGAVGVTAVLALGGIAVVVDPGVEHGKVLHGRGGLDVNAVATRRLLLLHVLSGSERRAKRAFTGRCFVERKGRVLRSCSSSQPGVCRDARKTLAVRRGSTVRDVAVPALALGVRSGRDRNVDGDLPSSSVGSELDAGAGARSREATASGVATRVLFVAEVHQRLELADDVRVAPEPEVSVNALLRHGQPQLVEPGDLRPRERLTCGIRPQPLPATRQARRGAPLPLGPTTRSGATPIPTRSRLRAPTDGGCATAR
jgi:hypothetical protein